MTTEGRLLSSNIVKRFKPKIANFYKSTWFTGPIRLEKFVTL